MEQYIDFRVGHFFVKNGIALRLTPKELKFILLSEDYSKTYHPILLTDSVLRKMNFKYYNQFGPDNSYYKLEYCFSTIIIHYHDLTHSYYCSYQNCLPTFKYVHQLQDFLNVNYKIIIGNKILSSLNQIVNL
jgi:hypothetical protein